MAFEQYDENYPRAFAELVESIRTLLPRDRVEHVGSTSVPGLGGRRVLDVVIPAAPKDQERIRAALFSLGFTDFPYAHIKPMLKGSVRWEGQEYPVLLYLLPEEHEYFTGWMAFREYMRQHPEEIERYAEVKRAAVARGDTDPWRYQQAKTPYLEDLGKRIRSGGSPGGRADQEIG